MSSFEIQNPSVFGKKEDESWLSIAKYILTFSSTGIFVICFFLILLWQANAHDKRKQEFPLIQQAEARIQLAYGAYERAQSTGEKNAVIKELTQACIQRDLAALKFNRHWLILNLSEFPRHVPLLYLDDRQALYLSES